MSTPEHGDTGKNAVSLRATITTVCALAGAAAVTGGCWQYVHEQYANEISHEVRVTYKGATPKPGPAAFFYDQDHQQLVFRGTIDDAKKMVLLNLIDTDWASDKDKLRTYNEAIDALSYRSNDHPKSLIVIFQLLIGLSGVFGVMMRSIIDFIGNFCYKKEFDPKTWWPWYVLRPFLGYLSAIMLVQLVQSGLFSISKADQLNLVWMIGLAFLGGFGADDVMKRLRLLSKTLFGSDGDVKAKHS